MGLLFIVALVLAWPTFGLSLVAWFLLAWFSAARKAADKKLREQRRTLLELMFQRRFADFFLALGVPTYSRAEFTAEEAEQCGRHILNYLAHNPGEASLFIRGVEKHSLRNGAAPYDAAAAAHDEKCCSAEAEIHLVAYRAIVAIASNNKDMPCFSNVIVPRLKSRADDIEKTRQNHAADPPWLQVVREWLTYESSFDRTGGADRAASIQNLKHLLLGHAVYGPNRAVRRIPREIEMLSKLEAIHLQNNCVTVLPDEIGNLPKLRVLKLGSNGLRTLPAAIGRLQNLEVLTAWRNEIESLPPEIGLLKNLKGLSLWGNPISKLPDEIVELRNLECLELFDMPNLQLSDSQNEWISHLSVRGCDVSGVEEFGRQNPELQAAKIQLAVARYRRDLHALEGDPANDWLRDVAMFSGRLYLSLSRGHNGDSPFDEDALMHEIDAACASTQHATHT
jgi:hypothetical protein